MTTRYVSSEIRSARAIQSVCHMGVVVHVGIVGVALGVGTYERDRHIPVPEPFHRLGLLERAPGRERRLSLRWTARTEGATVEERPPRQAAIKCSQSAQ